MFPTSSEGPLEVELACDECGRAAAGFELLPAGVPRQPDQDQPLWDVQQPRIYCWNFERSGDSELDPNEYAQLRSILQARDWQALSDIDWHYTVPWCKDCDRCYCIDHWTIEYDNSPLCSEWGTCPRGHGKILDY